MLAFFAVFGPGFITANVDNDPGGILTYSQAGAKFGYALLWTLIPITIALIVVQEMAARMGAGHWQRDCRISFEKNLAFASPSSPCWCWESPTWQILWPSLPVWPREWGYSGPVNILSCRSGAFTGLVGGGGQFL